MFLWIKRSGAVALLTAALGISFLSGLAFGTPPHQAVGQAAVDAETQLFTTLYKQVNPSVVSISVRIPTSASPDLIQPLVPGQPNGTPSPYATGDASGFIYDTAGHIVTNAHVVQDADRVEVTFADDVTVTAKVVGTDLDSDLAVLKVDTDQSRLVPIMLADSDQVSIGQRVFAIGNPFAYANSMSQGIISGLNRRLDSQATTSGGQDTYQIPGMIQTDTAINPGNSGGPLFDMTGRVLAINTLIESRVRQSSGVGFGVPSNLVKKFADLLIKNGTVTHSYLGIKGGDLTADINNLIGIDPNQRGVLISEVSPGSPAEKASLQPSTTPKTLDNEPINVGGDIIVAVDGVPIHHFEDLLAYLFSKTDVGQTITVTVLRDGKQIDVKVTLAERPH
ncbi:MAG: S1C family serine protease [Aggregatilineales bacterium]